LFRDASHVIELYFLHFIIEYESLLYRNFATPFEVKAKTSVTVVTLRHDVLYVI